jgi:DNA-binding PadR family transcriptional regulator
MSKKQEIRHMNPFNRLRAMRHPNQDEPYSGDRRRFAFGERPEHGADHEGRGPGRGRGHGHGHGKHDHRGPGGRLRRLLEHGDLRMLVLHLIAEKPRHGYEIIKAIEDLAGGAYAPSPGVVYPTLTLLEDLGHVTSMTEGNRKSFTITPEGAAALAIEQKAVDAILARIAQTQGNEPALPILRAMENLKTTLRLKSISGATTPELIRKAADIIDHAARSIEDL